MAENTTYTVKSGDTLSEIAVRYGTTVSKLMSLNPSIKDPDVIYAGEEIVISGEAAKEKANTSSMPVVTRFGIVSGTDNTLYAQWTWDKYTDKTDGYMYMWYYDTGDNIWFNGNGEEGATTKNKYATYTIPDNAVNVGFRVRAVSKTYESNDKEVVYFTAKWSTFKTYNTKAVNGKFPVPPAPSISIEGYTLTMSLENLDIDSAIGQTATHVTFQIYRDDERQYKAASVPISVTKSASYSCLVKVGSSYRVRCRITDNPRSGASSDEWSPWSESVETPPGPPGRFVEYKASSETSVYLAWGISSAATSYSLQYTTNKKYFDIPNDQVQTVSDIKLAYYEHTGLSPGAEYFFRVKAVNDSGESEWNAPVSVIIGKKPSAPTTWSSTTTAISGEPVTLYWMHNAEDGSDQTYADVELYCDGVKEITETVKGDTNSYSIKTTQFREGTKIEWRVRTAGITKEFGSWSVRRVVDIYAPPTLELNLTKSSGASITRLKSFPAYVSALAGPKTQTPTGYHLTITPEYNYETVDNTGTYVYVNAGNPIYSEYFDTSEDLLVELSPRNINLENNVLYTITCTVSMDSGLTCEESIEFTVAWEDIQDEPNAEIGFMRDSYTTFIRPYCEDVYGNIPEDVRLAVYRRDYDGKFTEIASGLKNGRDKYITDPHPSLDFARYRIVSTHELTGAISYYDIPDYPIGCKEIIIQWDESWTTYTTFGDDEQANANWTGSMLRLPYNIDVSDSNTPDVVLVEYMGRQHPVSYYGTQLGETSSWNVVIPKSDTETLSTLRRLSRWMGDVYVREPSGSGYWAHITVTFPLKHRELTIPVSINITRVEGGM